jgi:hypothetical protein
MVEVSNVQFSCSMQKLSKIMYIIYPRAGRSARAAGVWSFTISVCWYHGV